MAQLILTRGNSFHRAVRTQGSFPLTLRVGKYFLFFVLTFFIGIMSFFYLMKSTEIQTSGFQLKRLELERSKLEDERETKNTEISRLRALSGIRESDITNGLVPVKNPIFIKKEDSIASLTGTGGRP